MSELLTASELAEELRMSWPVVLRYYRAGKIKAEFLIGRSPRFDLAEVRKQLSAASKRKVAVPTL